MTKLKVFFQKKSVKIIMALLCIGAFITCFVFTIMYWTEKNNENYKINFVSSVDVEATHMGYGGYVFTFQTYSVYLENESHNSVTYPLATKTDYNAGLWNMFKDNYTPKTDTIIDVNVGFVHLNISFYCKEYFPEAETEYLVEYSGNFDCYTKAENGHIVFYNDKFCKHQTNFVLHSNYEIDRPLVFKIDVKLKY